MTGLGAAAQIRRRAAGPFDVRVKTILFVAASLLVAGCETDSGWVPGETAVSEQPHLAVPPRAAPAPAPVVTTAPPAIATPPAAPPPEPPADVPQPQPQIASAPVPNLVDAHCRAVAHQRAADAHANGFSFEMSDIVYDGTYKDCVAWASQHGVTRQ